MMEFENRLQEYKQFIEDYLDFAGLKEDIRLGE